MGLAIQAGLLAAFVVVFLPLGMAGWHLTRNRLLFFSVALFITLAVSVHVAPYFPSIPSLFAPFKPQWSVSGFGDSFNRALGSRSHCVSLLHDVKWEDDIIHWEDEDDVVFTRNASDPCFINRLWSWEENVSAICSFQKVNKTDALQLLKGSWIMVAGDSQARLFLLSLLDHLLQSTDIDRGEMFERHSNYTVIKSHIKFEFVWAPYVSNLTRLVVDLRHNRSYPDVLVMGDGLWHMLHVTNASEYLSFLIKLQRAIYSLFPASSYFNPLSAAASSIWPASNTGVPQLFWLNIPKLITPVLNTQEKRQKLTGELRALYDSGLKNSKLLQPEGPLTLLNLHHFSKGCGFECTSDGMHYCGMVYEAAVQVMLNALLIATQQAPSK